MAEEAKNYHSLYNPALLNKSATFILQWLTKYHFTFLRVWNTQFSSKVIVSTTLRMYLLEADLRIVTK